MSRIKILVTIDWFLPGTKAGGPVRSVANLIAYLPQFDFYIVTSDRDYLSDQNYEGIKSDCWIDYSENTKIFYFSNENFTKQNFEQLFTEVQPALVYINGVYSYRFSQLPLKIANQQSLRTIIASRGMYSPHSMAVKKHKQNHFLKLQNLRKVYRNAEFHVTSEQEKKDIHRKIKKYKKIEVLLNLPRKIEIISSDKITKQKGQLDLLYLGRISKEKGTLAGLKALQGIIGEVNLDIFGSISDENYWLECQKEMEYLPKNIQVKYKGNLNSEEIPNTFKNYHFLYSPTEGENYGHSIVEAFMSGTPVIIRDTTPWKNLEQKQVGWDVHLDDLPKSIQAAVNLSSEDYSIYLTKTHQYAINQFDNTELIQQYERLFSKT